MRSVILQLPKTLETEINSNNETKCNICNELNFDHEKSESHSDAFSMDNALI